MEHLLSVRSRVLDGILAVPSIQRVLEGQLSKPLYVAYLTNVYHYARHSATVIALAGSRCVGRNDDLAQYLFHHADEELGHEQWALDDLSALGVDSISVLQSQPVPACSAMIGFEYYTAGHANPAGLFGWLYTLEAMGDDLGGRIATAVAAGLGGSEAVKFLAGHGVADKDHTEDLTRVISTMITTAEDRAAVDQVADVVADLYVRMFQQIGASIGE